MTKGQIILLAIYLVGTLFAYMRITAVDNSLESKKHKAEFTNKERVFALLLSWGTVIVFIIISYMFNWKERPYLSLRSKWGGFFNKKEDSRCHL